MRIAAADALCNLGETATVLPILTQALQHKTPFVRLRAMNVLDRIGDDAKPTVKTMRHAAMKKGTIFPGAFLTRMTQYVTAKWEKTP